MMFQLYGSRSHKVQGASVKLMSLNSFKFIFLEPKDSIPIKYIIYFRKQLPLRVGTFNVVHLRWNVPTVHIPAEQQRSRWMHLTITSAIAKITKQQILLTLLWTLWCIMVEMLNTLWTVDCAVGTNHQDLVGAHNVCARYGGLPLIN